MTGPRDRHNEYYSRFGEPVGETFDNPKYRQEIEEATPKYLRLLIKEAALQELRRRGLRD